MVHALEESWRVVRDGGRMIDLRPIASGWPVEIVSRGTKMLAGQLADDKRIRVDVASNNAVLELVQRGWFTKENEAYFEYYYDWDSVDEMIEYVNDDWSKSATVPDIVISEARRLVQTAGERAVIRIRRKMVIACYRKLTAYD